MRATVDAEDSYVVILKRIVSFFYILHALFFGALAVGLFSANSHIEKLHAKYSSLSLAAFACVFVLIAVCFGMAWHTVRKGLPSARYWVIVPTLIFLAAAAGAALRYSAHPRPLSLVYMLGLGVAGPIVAWRKSSRTVTAGNVPIPKIKGDGTSTLLNQCGYLFSALSYIGSLMLWNRWLVSQGLPLAHRGLVQVILVSLVATFCHELGHAGVGIAFKMKLRAFVVGPFIFRIEDGHWKFNFNLAGFLTIGGATGVVPTSATQPSWQQLAMIAAGPATNFYFGILSGGLALALTKGANGAPEYVYPLALFAIINFVDCFTNLIPLRTATGYSDGAQMYQILSGGAWAAYHRSMSVVSASLVTPLRPRDFDMEAIDTAAQTIDVGMKGVLLRLFKYSHFLDCGLMKEAGAAIKEAEAVYDKPGTKLPTELHTVFVFANAYVLRDASAARTWWDRMVAMKPKKFGVDYWLASSALQWISGNSTQANEDWAKARDKANKLPAAGAYESDRSRCTLLRQVLDGDTTPPEIVQPTREWKPESAGILNGTPVASVVASVAAPVAQAAPVAILQEPSYSYSYLQPRTGEMKTWTPTE
jgi:hypothetical protein